MINTCKYCGNDFFSMVKDKPYCSNECRNLAANQKMLVESIRNGMDISKLNQCEKCGQLFLQKTIREKFCCAGCRENSHKRSIIKKQCFHCGEMFNSLSENHIFCSVECELMNATNGAKFDTCKRADKVTKSNYYEHVKIIVEELVRQGIEKSNNISEYSYNSLMTSSKRDKIRERDFWACRICGKKTSLEVHHIVKVIHGGGNEDSNLITLCTSCHRAIDTLNEEYAIEKCTLNAEKYLGIIEGKKVKNDEITLENTKIRLVALYREISKTDGDFEKILMKLDNIIEKCEEGY